MRCPRNNRKGNDLELHGALANILALCSEAKTKIPSGMAEGSQLSVVAGARNHRDRHSLYAAI
jgi:hypothetical protein